MLGVFMLGVIGVGVIAEAYKHGSYDNEKRSHSQSSGESYYIDYNGHTRRTDNNHKVLCNMHDWSNGDRVDIDMKTGEYLNRVADPKRIIKEEWLKECKEFNKRNKKKAIEDGKPYYYGTVQIDNVNKYSMRPGEEIFLRVSDDLPLEKKSPIQYIDYIDERTGVSLRKQGIVMRDFNLGLYVGTKKKYDEKDYQFIKKWKEYNWMVINEPLFTGKAKSNYIYNNGFFEQIEYNTAEKKEAYARKIGAFL